MSIGISNVKVDGNYVITPMDHGIFITAIYGDVSAYTSFFWVIIIIS